MEPCSKMNSSSEYDWVSLAPGLPPSDISRIQKSFRLVAARGEKMVSRFYDLLLFKSPELRSFFPPDNLSQQHTKFLNGLHTLVLRLENPQEVRAILTRLGDQHRQFGVGINHYPPVLNTLLDVLTEMGGDFMDGGTYEAWNHFLHLIRAIMLENHAPDLPIENRQEKALSTLTPNATKRILLIDDDRHLLDLYQSYLEAQGYMCSQVSDVAWAFTHLQISHYDLVLTDYQMPGMDGIQLRKTLKDTGKEHCPPFVLITGSLSQGIEKQAFHSGFVAVLKKPHDLGELSSIVRFALKRSATMS